MLKRIFFGMFFVLSLGFAYSVGEMRGEANQAKKGAAGMDKISQVMVDSLRRDAIREREELARAATGPSK